MIVGTKERHEARVSQALTQPDVMNLDDESHLSAYLDDELDPADRLAVEWSVESSPPLADQLRSIALARQAVAGLDRPPIPRDLGPAVGSRIAADRRRARLRALARPARAVLAVSGFSAVAASLIFALILLNRSLHPSPERPIIAARDEQAPAPRPHPIEPSDPAPITILPSPKLVDAGHSPRTSDALPEDVLAPVGPPAPPGEVSEREDRRVIAKILERPHVRRVVIVTDDDDAPRKVEDLISQDARRTPEFGRITICQDLVIDPERAEAAEVFAVPMDERGRRAFVERLQRLFPDLVEEGPSSPELVTQLSEVGQVALFRGAEAAPLGEPPSQIRSFVANRELEPPPLILGPDRGPPAPTRSGDPAPLSLVDSTAGGVVPPKDPKASPNFVGPPDLDGIAGPRPGEPVTLLVWVTRPPRR